MGIVRKIKDGARWIEDVVEFEAPRPKPVPEPEPEQEKPERADLLTAMFAAWRAEIDSIPFRFNISAPEATR